MSITITPESKTVKAIAINENESINGLPKSWNKFNKIIQKITNE